MLYNYSITYLKEDNFETRIEDICSIVKNGVAIMPLFMFQITPKRNPPIDYVSEQIRIYRRYREKLDNEGISCGVLLQATLALNEKETYAPFQPYIGLATGNKDPYEPVYCPSDQKYRDYIKFWLKKIAMERPKAIMLDDDFNLMMRAGKGCACPYHLHEFNLRAGTNMSREELYAYLQTCKKGDSLKKIYTSLQTETIVEFAKELRAIIDEIDPKIQGINCASGHFCDSVVEVNKVFCGQGNPTIVRIPNGNYSPYTVRGSFSALMSLTARCGEKVKRGGVDVILSETDTIPYSRYAKAARYLHSQYTSALLDGVQGAKHWLSSFYSLQKNSGVAYREILAKHKKFYDSIIKLVPINWVGINSPFSVQEEVEFNSPNIARYQTNASLQSNIWVTKHFEEMGLPFYFSDKEEPASFFEPAFVDSLSNEEIDKFFQGSVFLDVDSAKKLIERGYQDVIGVEISDWDLGEYQGEVFDENMERCCWAQNGIKKLQLSNEKTEVLSWVYSNKEKGLRLLAPAVTRFKRENGKYTVVFCGTQEGDFFYRTGFAFMNEERKAQLVTLLRQAEALPIYVEGDAELCVRAGYLKDGRLLCAIFELGLDPMDEISLFIEKEPQSIKILSSQGEEVSVEFSRKDENIYIVKTKIEPMYPVILLIQ